MVGRIPSPPSGDHLPVGQQEESIRLTPDEQRKFSKKLQIFSREIEKVVESSEVQRMFGGDLHSSQLSANVTSQRVNEAGGREGQEEKITWGNFRTWMDRKITAFIDALISKAESTYKSIVAYFRKETEEPAEHSHPESRSSAKGVGNKAAGTLKDQVKERGEQLDATAIRAEEMSGHAEDFAAKAKKFRQKQERGGW
jgi:hypothetical protein